MTQRRLAESSQQQDARIPASEIEYWETIASEAQESGNDELYQEATRRAYGDYRSEETPETETPIG